jgi:nucleoside phosphorylase
MGEHNVVLASLAAGVYGTTSAATTASSLLASLPQIRIGLLVGIGGGISRPDNGRDIRLGDIVVSQPDGQTGGVIQYDVGKEKPNQKWERKGFLNMPPQVLLQALSNLQAEHLITGSKGPDLLKEMGRANPRMMKSTPSDPGFVHQGFNNDRLFKSSYEHTGDQDCSNCDPKEEIQRNERDSTEPVIHYGIIASGNKLIKDAAARDRILESIEEECLCFEMEAAGLMNHFPCLVIRGICDYADSHKNDRWQRYASATAAAYGKELLTYVPVRDLQETQRAIDILRSSWYHCSPFETVR